MGAGGLASLDRVVIGGAVRKDYRSYTSLSHYSGSYTGAAVTGLERLERRTAAHLRIGRMLVAHTPPGKRVEVIFEIVNQLSRASSLMTAPEEREQLAEFNLIAHARAGAPVQWS
jgi:hypothetical protein